ncbi:MULTISPECIES: ABC transporter ATP-binding protein [unclassified Devosia]|uniref:ATP-binding cassette domain-containing protein n=1 Tax=unclassified Devosia TaxID=196773 RepID=UPI00145ECAE9|nr:MULTISPECIES: ABC transporter ATP-binding protein [unclassified Devosia]MBJ6986885.1 ABC transporter ATP-binding protein [Devosia sp. MC521]QMW63914.1 ABC transporter ATP-binding protein [Devosia sp. MC521]
MSLLSVANLTVKAGNKVLVSELSFTLDKGERLGLIGESGSGKSLTSLAVTGLLARGLSAEGSVVLNDTQIIGAKDSDLNPLRGTTVAIVFQEPLTALDPLMRVGEQISEVVARRAKRDGDRLTRIEMDADVAALMREVNLPASLASKYPHEMSGGQRQRIAIAMALACKPELLIADEPTTALDVTTQAEIMSLIKRLVAERNMALLFISHDLPVVANTVDRVVVMRHGVAVEAGAVGEVFRSPQHDYTKSLLAAAKAFDNAIGGQA